MEYAGKGNGVMVHIAGDINWIAILVVTQWNEG
jgi:hypothetical protein